MRNAKAYVPASRPIQQDNSSNSKKSCLSEINRLQKEREERRRLMEQAKLERVEEEQRNRENGTPGDVDFQRMIRKYRETAAEEREHVVSDMKITICVRKRPISTKEIDRFDYDSVTCLNPLVVVHDCKLKVDGISKYLDNTNFQVDHTFHEDNSTDDIYYSAVQPLVDFAVSGGRVTVFAYGQTGSGKTYTMQGIQALISEDLFRLLGDRDDRLEVLVSFFEIYGGRCQDLLNNRQRLSVREDGGGEVVIGDLLEVEADSVDTLQAIIDTGNRNRTTHATESNDESSRSHAICQISVRGAGGGREVGRLSLIDLAGSERGADTKSHNRQRRMEGAEINKSLLALKECIRALDGNSAHVPYRGSKLTLVLKDSFTRPRSRTVMIATVSPAASCADHTINTLRYADRIKEKPGLAARNSVSPQPPLSKPSAASATIGSKLPAAPPGHPRGAPAPASSYASAKQQPQVIGRELERQRDEDENRPPVRGESKHLSSRRALDENREDLLRDELEDLDFGNLQLSPSQQQEQAETDAATDELHRTVQDLFEEEEALLNLHMNIIQENAELLTEEGRLLQQMQGEASDIDAYALRLDEILTRKQQLIGVLRERLAGFRKQLVLEETASRRVRGDTA